MKPKCFLKYRDIKQVNIRKSNFPPQNNIEIPGIYEVREIQYLPTNPLYFKVFKG